MAGLNIVDLSGQYPGLAKGTLSSVQGLVVHHTASSDSATPQQIAAGWVQSGNSAQYIMGRDGTIYQMMPAGAKAYQIKPSWEPATSWANNSTTQGIELIAQNDKDVTPAQVHALQQFALQQAATYGYDPATHVVGHGEVNGTGAPKGTNPQYLRQTTEGMTAVNALRSSIKADPSIVSAYANNNAPPLPLPDPRTALGAVNAVGMTPVPSQPPTIQSPQQVSDFYSGFGLPSATPPGNQIASVADANNFYNGFGLGSSSTPVQTPSAPTQSLTEDQRNAILATAPYNAPVQSASPVAPSQVQQLNPTAPTQTLTPTLPSQTLVGQDVSLEDILTAAAKGSATNTQSWLSLTQPKASGSAPSSAASGSAGNGGGSSLPPLPRADPRTDYSATNPGGVNWDPVTGAPRSGPQAPYTATVGAPGKTGTVVGGVINQQMTNAGAQALPGLANALSGLSGVIAPKGQPSQPSLGSPQQTGTISQANIDQYYAAMKNSQPAADLALGAPASIPNSQPSYTTKTIQVDNPAYADWLKNQNSAIYGVQGVATPSLNANGKVMSPDYASANPKTPIPPKTITQTIRMPQKYVTPPVAQPLAIQQPRSVADYQALGLSPGAAYNAASAPALMGPGWTPASAAAQLSAVSANGPNGDPGGGGSNGESQASQTNDYIQSILQNWNNSSAGQRQLVLNMGYRAPGVAA